MGLDGISASLQKLISPATLESLTKAPNCSILSGTCHMLRPFNGPASDPNDFRPISNYFEAA